RIDYFFVDEATMGKVTDMTYLNDQMGSDHCPVVLEIT
ncbi:MAG: exodeoxyribonuclease III, partial [Rhodospirillales bacterium]|nr:exodeoxyribonuclease III [Rhodospirillales bacterium]